MKSRFIIGLLLVVAIVFGFNGSISAAGDDITIDIPPISGWEPEALPGLRGDLAYSPDSDLWLVASERNGIIGQMMNEDNEPVESLLNISPDGLAPKVAYDPTTQKFLIAWKNSDGTAVYGQFADEKGALSGGNFKIYDGNVNFESGNRSSIKYDDENKRFVMVWQEYTSPISATLVAIDGTGKVVQTVNISDANANLRLPDVAVNSAGGEYCVSYQWDGASNKIGVRSVNAGTGALGPQTFIDENDSSSNWSIGYSPISDSYTALWQSNDFRELKIKQLTDCGDDPNSAAYFWSDDVGGWAMMSYNPASDTYGIATQSSGAANYFYIIDAYGGTLIADYTLFQGGINGNFYPVIRPNTKTGTYAAISSQDRTQTKFFSNLGSGQVSPVGGQPFAVRPKPTVPTQGLPTDLGQLIQMIFGWSLALLGIAVFVMFFYAGFLWLTAAGNTARVGEAKQRMTSAVFGAILLLSSYLILYTINPDFVMNSVTLPGLKD